MSYTTPATKANGDTLSATDWNTYVRDNEEDLNGRLAAIEFSGARWTKGATQSLADGAATNISFPTSQPYDVGGWGLTASNTTATVPAGAIPAGFTSIVVLVTAFLAFDSDSAGRRAISIEQNGTSIVDANWDPGPLTTAQSVSTEVEAVAGDTFVVVGYQDSGGGLDVVKGAFTISRRAPF